MQSVKAFGSPQPLYRGRLASQCDLGRVIERRCTQAKLVASAGGDLCLNDADGTGQAMFMGLKDLRELRCWWFDCWRVMQKLIFNSVLMVSAWANSERALKLSYAKLTKWTQFRCTRERRIECQNSPSSVAGSTVGFRFGLKAPQSRF